MNNKLIQKGGALGVTQTASSGEASVLEFCGECN